jgi:hypothetical protein
LPLRAGSVALPSPADGDMGEFLEIVSKSPSRNQL